VAPLIEAMGYKPTSNGVIGIFSLLNLPGCTMTVGSTQPLTDMSSRYIFWGIEVANVKG